MEKFKANDRVINLLNTEIVPAQTPGTIICLIDGQWEVRFDNGITIGRFSEQIELVTEPITEPSAPTPEMGPVEGTMQYWRWEKSAAVLAGMLSNPERSGYPEDYAKNTVRFIDCLIAELKKGGKS